MIYFLRHGIDNEEYLGGWSDISITEEGKKQIESVALKLKKYHFKKIITSDVLRTKETGKILSDILNIKDVESGRVFNEQNKGLLNGMKKSIAYTKYPEYKNDDVDTVYPKGESLMDLYNRIKSNLEYIMSIDDNTLIVTHRGVINMLYYILNDIELDMNKDRFNVDYASLHGLDKETYTIKKIL